MKSSHTNHNSISWSFYEMYLYVFVDFPSQQMLCHRGYTHNLCCWMNVHFWCAVLTLNYLQNFCYTGYTYSILSALNELCLCAFWEPIAKMWNSHNCHNWSFLVWLPFSLQLSAQKVLLFSGAQVNTQNVNNAPPNNSQFTLSRSEQCCNISRNLDAKHFMWQLSWASKLTGTRSS
jgi:hypothetical protein